MTRRTPAIVAITLLLACAACGKDRADPPGIGGAGAATARVDSGGGATPVSAQAASGTAKPAAWEGSYKSVQGTMYIPPDWKDVHWKLKETDVGVGEGTMAMRVDPATGRASGTLDGPLGPAMLDGVVTDGKLTASIARKDPTDQGFTGTLMGTSTNGKLEGTMNLSSALVSAVRAATFVMTPGSAKPATP